MKTQDDYVRDSNAQVCVACGRKRPEYIADPSCGYGGYCNWASAASLIFRDDIEREAWGRAYTAEWNPGLLRSGVAKTRDMVADDVVREMRRRAPDDSYLKETDRTR